MKISGSKKFDLELLKRNTSWTGCYDENIKKYFWKYMEELSEEMKVNYLKFVWGRSSLPLNDSAFLSKHIIYV